MPSNDIAGTPRIIDEDYVVRELESIRRELRELRPSLMAATAEAIGTAVTFRHYKGGTTGFAVPSGTSAAVYADTVTVPSGFTQVGVLAVGSVTAKNQSGGLSYLYSRVAVGGDLSGLFGSELAANGAYAVSNPSRANILTGLAGGGTVALEVWAKGDPTWGTDAANAVFLNALLIFAR